MLRVLKLALTAALIAACVTAVRADLLTNGDFETGNLSGWVQWKADWSSGFSASAVSAAKLNGSYGLRLQITGNASFGVYQQVSVTPGKYYQLAGNWRGYSGTGNWFEIILIDGAFDMTQADSAPTVFNNVVAGYDGHPSFNHPAPYNFGWDPFSATYENEVSPYITNGTRRASGNVMTVVLKIGSSGNALKPTAYIDDVTLTQVPEPAGMLALASGIGAVGLLRRKR